MIPARVRLSNISVKAYSATKERAAVPQIAERHIDNVHASSRVYTRFSWPPGPQVVTVWGSFNAWEKGVPLHRFTTEQEASVVIPLQPGNYEVRQNLRR